jgi:uncharacterized protein involved in outer membrane biogenesis
MQAKLLKWTLGGFGVVLLILLVVGFVLVQRLDGIVKSTVEDEGTAQLSLATQLEAASVSLFGGSLSLDGLTIANPDGYAAEHLFELGQVSASVGWRGLRDDPVRVDRVAVHSPQLVIERGDAEGLTDQFRLNLRELMSRLATDEEEAADEETTKLLIEEVLVTNARVVIRPNVPGLEAEYGLTLPDVSLLEVGTADEAQNGAELGRVAVEIAMALAAEAAQNESLPAEVRQLLQGDLASVVAAYGDKLGDMLSEELSAELGGAVGDAIRDAASGDLDKAAEGLRDQAGDEAKRQLRKGLGGLLGDDPDEAQPE